jgi:hypothetical protein
MAYGQAHVQTIPTVSVTAGPAYATAVNAVLTEIRTTLAAKVTPAGIDINADLTMRSGSTYSGITNLHRASLKTHSPALSAVTYPASLYAGPSGELHYNDAAGNVVPITLGGVVTGASGNVTGAGYAAGGVTIQYEAANLLYNMLAGTGVFADIKIDDLLLSDSSSNFLRIQVGAMASDYSLTLPAAPPASTSVLRMSSAGVVTADPAGAIATSGTLASGDLTVTGTAVVSNGITTNDILVTDDVVINDDLTVGGDLAVTGPSTLAAVVATDVDVTSLDVGAPGIISVGGLLCGADATVTVSGTGRLVHGDRQIVIPSTAFLPFDVVDDSILESSDVILSSTSVTGGGVDTFGHWFVDSIGSCIFFAPVMLPVGSRVKSVVLTYFGGGNAGTRRMQFSSTATATDTVTDHSAVSSVATTGVQPISSAALTTTMAATSDYWLMVTLIQADYLKSVLITYDQP